MIYNMTSGSLQCETVGMARARQDLWFLTPGFYKGLLDTYRQKLTAKDFSGFEVLIMIVQDLVDAEPVPPKLPQPIVPKPAEIKPTGWISYLPPFLRRDKTGMKKKKQAASTNRTQRPRKPRSSSRSGRRGSNESNGSNGNDASNASNGSNVSRQDNREIEQMLISSYRGAMLTLTTRKLAIPILVTRILAILTTLMLTTRILAIQRLEIPILATSTTLTPEVVMTATLPLASDSRVHPWSSSHAKDWRSSR
jgi:hypothetical protein